MITCSRCNHQNSDNASNCELCGADLKSAGSQDSEPTLAMDVEKLRKGAQELRKAKSNPLKDRGAKAKDKTMVKDADKLEAHSMELNESITDAAALEEMELVEAGAAFFDISSATNDVEPGAVSGAPDDDKRRPSLRLPGITSTVNKPKSASNLPQKKHSSSSSEPAGLAKLLQAALDSPGSEPGLMTLDPDKMPQTTSNDNLPGVASEGATRPVDIDRITDGDLSNFLMDALDQSTDGSPVGTTDIPDIAQKSRGTEHAIPAVISESNVACPHCNGNNPQGILYCIHCGGGLDDEEATSKADAGDVVPCPSCQHSNTSGNRFCGACGHNLMDESGVSSNTWSGAMGSDAHEIRVASQLDIKLISINEDGSDGVEIPLNYVKTVIGRSGDTRFPTDAFLSPKHASLTIDDGDLFIEDLYSLNGTFVKIRDEVELSAGDLFLMGRQVLRFEKFEQNIAPKARASDGTRYMGSPPPGGQYKLLQIGIGGIIQNVYCIPESGVVLGREKGEIIFPRDKFMSGRHAQIYLREDDRYCLVDLNSSNGTWIKIWERTQLHDTDFIFLGQQLFRVEIFSPPVEESE